MRMLGALLMLACATHSCALPAPGMSGLVALDLRAERLLCRAIEGAVSVGLLPQFIAQAAPCHGAGGEASLCPYSWGWEGMPGRPQ
jgi:hypothetical protein